MTNRLISPLQSPHGASDFSGFSTGSAESQNLADDPWVIPLWRFFNPWVAALAQVCGVLRRLFGLCGNLSAKRGLIEAQNTARNVSYCFDFLYFFKYIFKSLEVLIIPKWLVFDFWTYCHNVWKIFGTSRNITKYRPPGPLFMTEILQKR